MPAYISHAIMGQKVYEKGTTEKMFKVDLNEKEVRAFSLGSDLSAFSKISAYNSHNKNTQGFFINFIKYIKEHNLGENSLIMALLYGHMCHYFLDINCHPLIYYNEVGLEHVTKISNHGLVEGYISSYLCQKILNQDIMSVKDSFFTNGNLNDKEIKRLLSEVYFKTYNDPNIMRSYLLVQKSLLLLEKTIKSGLLTSQMLESVSGFKHFLEASGIKREELLNPHRELWTNPVTGDVYCDSFMDLYNKSIIDTINGVEAVNGYLYNGDPQEKLENIFTNTSFDTGVDCSLGHQMKFVRKKNLLKR